MTDYKITNLDYKFSEKMLDKWKREDEHYMNIINKSVNLFLAFCVGAFVVRLLM